jgi:hypothetical protein
MFIQIKFDDFNALNYEVSNLKFTAIDIIENDVDIRIDGDRVKLDVRNIGGSLSGHCQQK